MCPWERPGESDQTGCLRVSAGLLWAWVPGQGRLMRWTWQTPRASEKEEPAPLCCPPGVHRQAPQLGTDDGTLLQEDPTVFIRQFTSSQYSRLVTTQHTAAESGIKKTSRFILVLTLHKLHPTLVTFPKTQDSRTSPAVQWFRLHLPMQGCGFHPWSGS